VNPQVHDEFVALCALYYSGDISEEEWALLQIHMAYCDPCHDRFLEYQRITSDVIPAMAAAAASELGNARESAKSLEAAEKRLLSQLDSPSAHVEPPRSRRLGSRLAAGLIAACGLGLACLFGFEMARMNRPPEARTMQTPAPPAMVQTTGSARDRDVQQALRRSQEQVASLEQQVTASDNRFKHADVAIAGIEKQLAAEQSAHKQMSGERDRLTQQLATAQTELDSMRNKWASAGTDATQQAAHAAALETEVTELKAALDEKDVALSEKDRMLALDKDFLAHDRDIRDLIGARNLYIADIFDTNENGQTAKQFGRIFYTRDRSLVFYGFDLDSQEGHKQDVSFQVWGSGSDRPSPVSLGLFYQDDSHKRWVLRCNDAKSLARLDMVFVTVEPPGGSPRPTGKQLLRAYLQIHPNHP
jgi:anti-sigma-K factor RskA